VTNAANHYATPPKLLHDSKVKTQNSYWHGNINGKMLKPTSGFEASFVERLAYVVVGRKAIELGREGDCDVTFTEHLADGLAGVPVQQIVGADDDYATPVVIISFNYLLRWDAGKSILKVFSESNITASPSRPSSIADDDDDAAPVVLEEVFEEEVGELAERAERARQRRVGDLVVEVRVGGDPRDERNVEERRHFRHGPTRCTDTAQRVTRLCLKRTRAPAKCSNNTT